MGDRPASDSTTIDACVAKNGKVSIYPPGAERAWRARTHGLLERAGAGRAAGPAGAAGHAADRDGDRRHDHDHRPALRRLRAGPEDHRRTRTRSSRRVTPATGLATGKRQHKPFTITKELDKSTPLLMRAIYTNETLTSVLIGLLSPADGKTIGDREAHERPGLGQRAAREHGDRLVHVPEDHVDVGRRRDHRRGRLGGAGQLGAPSLRAMAGV